MSSTDLELPEEVVHSIDLLVDSLESLEVLVLLYRRVERSWSAAEVGQELGLRESAAVRELERLRARRTIALEPGSDDRYRLVSGETNGDPIDDVRRVAEAYGNRRIAVINYVASRAMTRIRSLADAFRFKKE
jgi:hypothetical protein